MGSVSPAFTFLLMIFSGWVHREQLIVIEYLQAENSTLRERLKGRRLRFTDAERALLARKAKAVGRKALLELGTIVSPGYAAAVAPSVRGGEVEFLSPASAGASSSHERHQRTRCSHGDRESKVGIYTHPRGSGQRWSPGRAGHGGQCTQAQWHRASATAW